jgi:antitoxin VapB
VSLYLKDAEVDRLARELAQLEGASLTETVRRALRDRHDRLLEEREAKRRRVEARLARIKALPVRDASDPDATIYDDAGLPRA